MALAFKRATKEATDAAAGYFSQFKDYYGIEDPEPIVFDWDSAKEVAGDSPHNANNEVLPKSVTIAKSIKSGANGLTGMVYNIQSRAGKEKDVAFELMKKHVKKIMMHFDDKNTTKKGECTWSCEVKDGVLHATMHFNFDQYMGRHNFEDVCEWLETYLDDTESLWFEISKARVVKDRDSGSNSRYFNSDSVGYLKEALGKVVPVEVNWDAIKATPGRSELYSNKPPARNNHIIVRALDEGRAMYAVRDSLSNILKDDMGKEAFNDAFTAVRIEASAASAHGFDVRKDGKTLVFDLKIKMEDHMNCVRNVDGKQMAKKIEELL